MVKFEPVSGDMTKAKTVSEWDKGESYVGYFKSFREVKTPNSKDPTKIFTMVDSNDDGEVLSTESHFWDGGGLKIDRSIAAGQLCKITCLGKEKNPKTGMSFVKFDLMKAPNHLPVVAAAAAPESEPADDLDFGE